MGEARLTGEVIALGHDIATIQVYEETNGLRPGEPLYGTGAPLSVSLGPGLLANTYDGLQRPLAADARSAGDLPAARLASRGSSFKKLEVHPARANRATLCNQAVCWAPFRKLR